MGDELTAGLYDALVTRRLSDLVAGATPLHPDIDPLLPEEAADRLAHHVAAFVERTLRDVPDATRVEVGLRVVASLLERLASDQPASVDDSDALDGRVLRALYEVGLDARPKAIERPMIPLVDTTLLTNAPGEPNVGRQLQAEIDSADQIDVVMAFIRLTGIAPLREPLRRHVERGRALRVLTTTYTGSTEARALDVLAELGADVRVSYDTSTTRLHAKAWLFHRRSGHSTAYIGSSNLTHSAQAAGLEWNVRVSHARNAPVIDKVAAVFDSYWANGDFRRYDPLEFAEATRTTRQGPTLVLSPIELRLEPFQERLLEEIEVARRAGRHRNLLVSATGTGKTVMAAVDYRRLRRQLPAARLLFVAHRRELLEKSRDTFRYALRDPSFGELWVGGQHPTEFHHVFASIQSLTARSIEDIDPSTFDVVIVDEFHHAAAPTYRRLLDHLRPSQLLGLTATPERADGQSILDWFDGRISAELRLWDAIDQQRLVPFSYFGIHDGLDYRQVPWRRGRGYDLDGLTNLYTANDVWARRVISELTAKVGDVHAARVLGFCCSVAHARWMSDRFNEAGITSVAVWGDTPDDERRRALADLEAGRITALFSVDLFNEGVDLPDVDTLLLLRPTDSPTLFLQQLGRGLRRADGKAECVVLDFVGHHRKEFRLDRRFRALIGGSRKELIGQVERGFPFLPAGCQLSLDPVASDLVLRNIREAVPTRWDGKAAELSQVGDVSLARFLDESGLDLEDVYTGDRGWSDLRETAGLPTLPRGPHEVELRRAVGRMLHLNDNERIDRYATWINAGAAPSAGRMNERERRLARMLVAALSDRVLESDDSLQRALDRVWAHPQVLQEVGELLDLLRLRVDHVQEPITDAVDVPLQVHGRYSRLEILAAFDVGSKVRPPTWQTGVWWEEDAATDLFAFTLDKTGGGFSPTTRYRDYAISPDLIHWESQSTTRAESEVGQRYQHHASMGTSVLLFARLQRNDRAFWCLGPASYVSHVSERPMQITWRLHTPLSGDLFAAFAAAVA